MSDGEEMNVGGGELRKARRRGTPGINPEALNRLPPHSLEAEQGVLGCVLLDPVATVPAALATVRPDGEAFYHVPHRMIFALVAAMFAAGEPVDLITVQQRLRDQQQLDGVGGLEYLVALQDKVPSAGNLTYYLDIVREKWLLRKVLRTCSEVCSRVHEVDGTAEQFVAGTLLEFHTLLAGAGQAAQEKHISTYVTAVAEDMEEHYTRGGTQLPPGYLGSGFDYMDKVCGGYAPTELAILAGRPGAGKTSLAEDIVKHLQFDVKWQRKTGALDENGKPAWESVTGGVPVYVFSLEMSGKSLGRRLMFNMAQVSGGKFKQGYATKGDFDKLNVAAIKLAGTSIWINERENQTIEDIAATARRVVREHGIKLFVLDYLQLVRTTRRGENRARELDDILNVFVALKKALEVPWIVLAQLNRDMEKATTDRRPLMSDLKDCGTIEQAADHVFILYPPAMGRIKVLKDGTEQRDARQEEDDMIEEVYGPGGLGLEPTEWPRRINGYEAKNRDGATGDVRLLFHRNQFRFEDWHAWEGQHFPDRRNKGEWGGKWKPKETEI